MSGWSEWATFTHRDSTSLQESMQEAMDDPVGWQLLEVEATYIQMTGKFLQKRSTHFR